MTVAQLIAELQLYSLDAEVAVELDVGHAPATTVYVSDDYAADGAPVHDVIVIGYIDEE